MSVIFSRSCEYAIQSVLFLAKKEGEKTVLLREISESLDIPYHFLSKVMQLLSRHGIVHSQKGANGGFTLNRSAHDITLADIVEAVDGASYRKSCVLGFPECNAENACPVHNQWKDARSIIETMLGQKDIEQLGKKLDKKLLSLKITRK